MTPNRVEIAMEKFKKYVHADKLSFLQMHLENASDDCMDTLMKIIPKSPTKTLLFSIFLGGLGVDRFYIGDTGIGITKLIFRLFAFILSNSFSESGVITAIGIILSSISSIWCLADLFITYKITKQMNYDYLVEFLKLHTV